MSIGKGSIKPASLSKTIDELFENERIKNEDGSRVEVLFSRASLTPAQVTELEALYPAGAGFTPVDGGVYVIYQTDNYDANNTLTSSQLELISFVQKGDGYIYGLYFTLDTGAVPSRFDAVLLTDSRDPVPVPVVTGQFTTLNYLEVYLKHKTDILLLSIENQGAAPFPLASLQFARGGNEYFESTLSPEGIVDADNRATALKGNSKNLKDL